MRAAFRKRKTERVVMMVEKSTLDELDDWGFSNHIRTRAETIRRLIHKGLLTSDVIPKEAESRTSELPSRALSNS